MLAMLWVGGGIIIHGLAVLGWPGPEHFVHHLSEVAAHAVPFASAVAGWFAGAAASGVLGLVIGALTAPLVEHALLPLVRGLKHAFGRG
jgi:predicted DNA repair protein MutK